MGQEGGKKRDRNRREEVRMQERSRYFSKWALFRHELCSLTSPLSCEVRVVMMRTGARNAVHGNSISSRWGEGHGTRSDIVRTLYKISDSCGIQLWIAHTTYLTVQ